MTQKRIQLNDDIFQGTVFILVILKSANFHVLSFRLPWNLLINDNEEDSICNSRIHLVFDIRDLCFPC